MPSLNTSLDATQSLSGMRRTYEVAARTLRGKSETEEAGGVDESFQALRASGPISVVSGSGEMLAATQIYSKGLDRISGSLDTLKRLAMQAGASGSAADSEPLNREFQAVKAGIALAAAAIGLDTAALGIDGTGISDPGAAISALSNVTSAAGHLGKTRTAVEADQQQLGQALGRAHSGLGFPATGTASPQEASDMANWLASQMQLGTSAIPAQANVTGAGVKALLRY